MTWLYYVFVAIVITLSFWIGKRYGENNVATSIVKARDEYWHDKFVDRWVKKYNRILQDVAVASLENEEQANKRNVSLIVENERLRRKAIRLALKYSYFRKKAEDRPKEDALSLVASAIHSITKYTK